MMTLQEIAQLIDGVVLGNPRLKISGLATINCARPDELTFAKNQKICKSLENSDAGAAIVPHGMDPVSKPCIQVHDVVASFEKIAGKFQPPIQRAHRDISPHAEVSPSATFGKNVCVYAGAYIGDNVCIGDNTRVFPGVCILEECRIGSDVTIFPNAVLYERTQVGDGSIIHAGAILGAWGFGYESTSAGHRRSVQHGNVEIGREVEIGACTTIDRGTYGPTRVGDGTKLDNQVMIGHNCLVGNHNMLCSQVGIAGSCRTGAFVVMAGQVGIGDHLTIGDHAVLGAKSGVMHDLEGGCTYLGAPAKPAREQFQLFAMNSKLPELRKRIKTLEKQIESILASQEKSIDPTSDSADGSRKAA